MAISDIFKASKNEALEKEILTLKDLNTNLQNELNEATKLLTPQHSEIVDLNEAIKNLLVEKDDLEKKIYNAQNSLSDLRNECNFKKQELVVLDNEILLQESGLYKPLYEFTKSDQYKDKLDSIRKQQKEMIQDKNAVKYLNGQSGYTKILEDNTKQILRCFNIECDQIIDNVKFTNIDSMLKRMQKSCQLLNKLYESDKVAIQAEYYSLKMDELHLAYEYQVKKQEEKEEQKRIRENEREQAKILKELEEAKKNILKDKTHFSNALSKLNMQLKDPTLNEEKRKLLLSKKRELEESLAELDKQLEEIDYRRSNQLAGYVYIISNIGAFGENIYKIGMTRRLEPQDRIDELGDASVPFTFDIHAMIFTEDAPKLENALHKAFENKKVNMVNSRREFFNVTLEEIEKVVKANFDKTVEFTKIPQAQQYRESLKLKQLNCS